MRHLVVPGVVLGATLALGLLTAVPVAAGQSSAASNDPKVLAAATNTAVKITHGSYGVVSSLTLPSGHWVVVAKVALKGASNKVAVAPAACVLSVGAFADESGASPSTLPEGKSETLLLTASATLSTSDAAHLRCKTTAPLGSVLATTSHIMAYRMDTLSTGLLGGSYTKVGSGPTKGIWGWAVNAPTLPGGGSAQTVGSLPLTPGRWWIIGKAWFQNGLASPSNVLCGLYAGNVQDVVDVSMGAHNDTLDQRTATVQQTVSTASAIQANLECVASGATVDTSWVELVAIKVGKLTTKALGGSSQTQGNGTPRVIEGHRDAAQTIAPSATFRPVGQIALPAGRWAVVATGILNNNGYPFVKAECQLEVGAGHDRAEADLWHYTNAAQSVNLQLLVALPSGGHATVACRETGSHQQVAMTELRIVAMRTR